MAAVGAAAAATAAVLLYNPEAGQQPLGGARTPEPAWLADTLLYLRQRGLAVEAVASVSPAMATRVARDAARRRLGLVIAAGGDGTVRAVADGLAGTDTALGILPRGTINVLARHLAIPLDNHLAACDICLRGALRRLDLGRAGAHHFLLMCSIGLDATAVGNVNVDIKGWMGAPAYVLSGLATLATYTPPDMAITLDGETIGDGYAPYFALGFGAPF